MLTTKLEQEIVERKHGGGLQLRDKEAHLQTVVENLDEGSCDCLGSQGRIGAVELCRIDAFMAITNLEEGLRSSATW